MRLFWVGVLDLNGNLYILWKSLFTERRQIMDKKSGGSLFICHYCLSKLLNCWHQLDIYAGLQQAFHSRVLVCTAFKVKAWIYTQIASVLNMKQSLNGQFPGWVAFLPSSNIDPFFVPDVYSTVLIENGYIYFLTRCHAVDPRENPKTRYLFFVCCLLTSMLLFGGKCDASGSSGSHRTLFRIQVFWIETGNFGWRWWIEARDQDGTSQRPSTRHFWCFLTRKSQIQNAMQFQKCP